jgi:hypothetical protein
MCQQAELLQGLKPTDFGWFTPGLKPRPPKEEGREFPEQNAGLKPLTSGKSRLLCRMEQNLWARFRSFAARPGSTKLLGAADDTVN